jgi:glycosyltransferase involved in cell wall biosynthesis
MTPSLSVVIPVYNERADDLAATLAGLSLALRRSPWSDPELIIVDDGSDPPVAVPPVSGAEVRILRQANSGRFEARRAGIEKATGEYILLLDARVTLAPTSLDWVADRVGERQAAWNGHCLMANLDSPFAQFWNVLTHVAFADYLDHPRTTSFGLSDYDRYPKGTGHFLAPRAWLMEAIADFSSQYADSRFSSDDTHLLRAIAARDRINISPEFASIYRNREALRPFLRHAVHRGTTFYDGFFRPGTRFFPVVVASFPGSIAGAALALRRPRMALGAALALSGLGAGFARGRGRPSPEAASFGTLIVPFATAYCAGIWRGAWLAARNRTRP